MSQQVHYFVSMPVYPQNSVQPQCRTRSKPNLNIIFVLIIVTDAQVFESVKKYGGQGYLAAPYCLNGVLGVVSGRQLPLIVICQYHDSYKLCTLGQIIQYICSNRKFYFKQNANN